MKEYSFTVDGQPMSKKRNYKIIKIGRHYSLGLKKKFKDWYEGVKGQLWIQKVQYQAGATGAWEPINEPVAVEFLFFIEGHGKIDLSNLYQGYEDALVAAGILADDSLIMSHDGSRKYLGQKRGHVLIRIKPFFWTADERIILKGGA